VIIARKRIMKLEPYFGHLPSGTEIILAVPVDQIPKEQLVRIGFGLTMGIGDRVLPSYELGPVSQSSQVDTIGGKVDRAELHVGLEEVLVLAQRHLEHLGELFVVSMGPDTSA